MVNGTPEAYIYKPGEVPVFTFTTPISFVIEAGFNYYLFKTYNEVDYDPYGTLFIRTSGYGDDFNDFNKAFGSGQTFKLQSETGFSPNDYLPRTYIPADVSVASDRRVGVVKPRARMSIDESENLDVDIPTSTELITNMNDSQFTNNTGTGKIDINTNLAELKGPKGDTGKGWTGASYGTGKVSFTSTDGTPFVFDTGDLRGGKGDNGTNGKGWTGASYSTTTGKVSFASTDGTPYVFDTGDLRGGAGTNGKGWTGATYISTTGKVSFTSTDLVLRLTQVI